MSGTPGSLSRTPAPRTPSSRTKEPFPARTAELPPAVPGHPLDHPTLASLTGPHAHFAERRGRLLRYPPDVSPWLALPDAPDAADWADAAALAGPGGALALAGYRVPPPDDWEVTFSADGVQLVGTDVRSVPDEEAVPLSAADVPEILDLVERTQPGPFLARTIEMGTYLGIRREGALVAMAGERLHPPGWVEISAVCTDPAFRGQGLAARLVLAVAHSISARDERPFLHAAASNTNAIRLYESLGFRLRRTTRFLGVRVPAGESRSVGTAAGTG
ncbi:GNAT family N-acetyltransferase [Streptomyces sp. NPDC057539]|uniref:GNAT family N-acetyltransferase n=1 Tax=Streptomyces sp. NPDC057539 TaxID=3346159 RepID=UPI00369D8113